MSSFNDEHWWETPLLVIGAIVVFGVGAGVVIAFLGVLRAVIEVIL